MTANSIKVTGAPLAGCPPHHPDPGNTIFPGGYIPALSRGSEPPRSKRAGPDGSTTRNPAAPLPETLKVWRERFLAHSDEADRLYTSARTDVGILSGVFGNGVPQARVWDEFSDSVDQSRASKSADGRAELHSGAKKARLPASKAKDSRLTASRGIDRPRRQMSW